jgi:hypothetical protein
MLIKGVLKLGKQRSVSTRTKWATCVLVVAARLYELLKILFSSEFNFVEDILFPKEFYILSALQKRTESA